MLHGFGMHSSHWLPFALLLSRKYKVIIPDLRGFGKSRRAPFLDECAISNLANDLNDLISSLDLSDFKIIAISMGALTALNYIERHQPSGLTRYLHIDQSPNPLNTEDQRYQLFGDEHTERLKRARCLLEALEPYIAENVPYDEIPSHLRKSICYELSEFYASALSSPQQKAATRALLSKELFSKQVLPRQYWTSYMHCLKGYVYNDYDFRDALKNIDIPVDILVGMKSEMYPASGQLKMADYLADCNVIPFTKSGHTPLIDQPIKLTQELFKFAAR